MLKPVNKINHFWLELKRRKVIRRNMVYAASGFVLLELVSIIAEPFGLPDWTLKLVFIILCMGFVISIILSWFYNFTPDGLERIIPTDTARDLITEKPSHLLAWKITSYISIVIIVGLLVFNIVKGGNQSGDLAGLEKSIAVLPFENMSTMDEHLFFGDAMTDEIILQLKIIKELRVISRASTLKYKDSKKIVSDIGEELNVNYLVDGTVQRQDDNVRIRVQVIRIKNEDIIWSETYDKEWEDIFNIQSDVAQQIAHELEAVLSPEEIEEIDKRPTDNLEAYDMYLQGRYFWNKRTKVGITEAIKYFNNAIKRDTNYALAYSGLADCYSMGANYGYISSANEMKIHFQKAKDAAIKALTIDNSLSEAYTSLALVKLYHEWDWDGAVKNFQRAIQLNPGYETAHQWYSGALTTLRQFDEAIAEVKLAQELDPVSQVIKGAAVRRLYLARRYDLAIEESQRAINITPDFFLTHRLLGLSYLKKGKYPEAVSELQKAVRYSGGNLITRAYMGYVYGATGDQTKAKSILNGLFEISNDGYVPSIAFAIIYCGLGENDNAISWLEKAYEERYPELIWLNTNPIYDPLSSDPRFIDLLKKMNLE